MSANNPVVYFEIPVTDISRAVKFYKAVFDFKFEFEEVDSYEMALFPFTTNGSGITGALAKGDVYKPSKEGALIYFRTDDIDKTLSSAISCNGTILYPKTLNEKYRCMVAEFEDSEGNRIALLQYL